MLRQIILVVFLISAVFGHPVENEHKKGKGYMQEMIEKAGLYGGDIMLTEEQKLGMKTGVIDEKKRWPKGVIPYEIVAGHFGKIFD